MYAIEIVSNCSRQKKKFKLSFMCYGMSAEEAKGWGGGYGLGSVTVYV